MAPTLPATPERRAESPFLSAFRFAVELAAWIAIHFAWGWIALVFAVAALALFNVPGDKHRVIVPTPGPVRIALEAAVTAAGVIAAWHVWGAGIGTGLLVASVLMFAVSSRRLAWLWRR